MNHKHIHTHLQRRVEGAAVGAEGAAAVAAGHVSSLLPKSFVFQ